MTDLRDAVLERLEDLGWNRVDVAKARGVTCHWSTVMRWLSGTSDLSARHVGEVMDVVGLRVLPARRHRRRPPRRRAS